MSGCPSLVHGGRTIKKIEVSRWLNMYPILLHFVNLYLKHMSFGKCITYQITHLLWAHDPYSYVRLIYMAHIDYRNRHNLKISKAPLKSQAHGAPA